MSQAGEPSPPDLPQDKDRHLESRDSHLRLAAGGSENDLKSSSTSEAPPVFLCEVNSGYACSHRMRDRCNAGDGPAKVHCLSRGCSVESVRDSVLGIAKVRDVFSGKT